MIGWRSLWMVAMVLVACGGNEPKPANTPATANSDASAAAEEPRPPSLAEGQQASMREYAQSLAASKASLEEALTKSDCKAACEAFNAMGSATERLCYTALTDDDQRQCKDAKDQQSSERERTEKSCEPCPPPPEKKHRRKHRNAR